MCIYNYDNLAKGKFRLNMVYVSVETRRIRTNRRCYLCIEKKTILNNSNTYLITG